MHAAHLRTLNAITASLSLKNMPGGASVMPFDRYYCVFDADGNLVANFFFDKGSDVEKDVARRRAHTLRTMLDAE